MIRPAQKLSNERQGGIVENRVLYSNRPKRPTSLRARDSDSLLFVEVDAETTNSWEVFKRNEDLLTGLRQQQESIRPTCRATWFS